MKLLIHLYLSSFCSVGLKIKSDAIGWQTICSVNQKIYKRTDTLWEGRYKASLIEAEPYSFAAETGRVTFAPGFDKYSANGCFSFALT